MNESSLPQSNQDMMANTNKSSSSSSSSVIYPQRHLALVSLALGFLIIWTAVLAGVLVSKTLNDNVTAEESLKIFHMHEDVGRIAFSLGHEMGKKLSD